MAGSDPRKNRRSSPFAQRPGLGESLSGQDTGQGTDALATADGEAAGPPWASPLWSLVLILLSLYVLLHDGLTPYRVAWRKMRWKRVFAVQAEVEIPVRRIEIRAGVDSQDPYAASAPKTKLGAEEMAKNKALRWKAQQAKEDRAVIRKRIVKRRTVEPMIFEKVSTRGVLFDYDVKRYFVRVSYTYRYGKKVFTKYREVGPRSFKSREAARLYLSKRFKHWPIKVWVDPADPSDVTAFLEYDGWTWIKLGFVGLFAGLVWMLLSLGARRKPASN